MARILLVEDHEALAVLRCAILSREGHQIVLTGDGQKACRLLAQESFDLVVTDAELPTGSGREVAMAAQKQHVPVILSTGWPQHAAHSPGVDFLATKPSSVGEFLSLVHSALQKAKFSVRQ